MIIDLDERNGGSRKPLEYTYTGQSEFTTDKKGWHLTFKTPGTLTITKIYGPIDIFAVGAGKTGGDGRTDSWGGSGGPGGERLTQRKARLKEGTYSITMGSGKDTTISGPSISMTARRYAGSPGGDGTDGYYLPSPGKDGGPLFDDPSEPWVGGSGGGGNFNHSPDPNYVAPGGKGGGGSGNSGAGTAPGAGGGGGRAWKHGQNPGGPGRGGALYMRNARR